MGPTEPERDDVQKAAKVAQVASTWSLREEEAEDYGPGLRGDVVTRGRREQGQEGHGVASTGAGSPVALVSSGA